MVSVQVTVDSDGAEERLDGLARAMRQPRELWDEVGDLFAENERQIFARGGSDSAWPGLSPRYARWKARNGGGQLMVRSGKLRDSLTRRPLGVEDIAGKTAQFGTDVHYARFHKNRRVVWVSRTQQSAWSARIRARLERMMAQ